jgi:hypothetical protein
MMFLLRYDAFVVSMVKIVTVSGVFKGGHLARPPFGLLINLFGEKYVKIWDRIG